MYLTFLRSIQYHTYFQLIHHRSLPLWAVLCVEWLDWIRTVVNSVHQTITDTFVDCNTVHSFPKSRLLSRSCLLFDVSSSPLSEVTVDRRRWHFGWIGKWIGLWLRLFIVSCSVIIVYPQTMVVLVAVINTISLIRAIQISLSVSSSEFQLHGRQMAEGKHRCCGFWTALMALSVKMKRLPTLSTMASVAACWIKSRWRHFLLIGNHHNPQPSTSTIPLPSITVHLFVALAS